MLLPKVSKVPRIFLKKTKYSESSCAIIIFRWFIKPWINNPIFPAPPPEALERLKVKQCLNTAPVFHIFEGKVVKGCYITHSKASPQPQLRLSQEAATQETLKANLINQKRFPPKSHICGKNSKCGQSIHIVVLLWTLKQQTLHKLNQKVQKVLRLY